MKEFEQRRKEASQKRDASGWKDLAVIGGIAGVGLYFSSDRFKKFVDENLFEIFNLSPRKVQKADTSGIRTRNHAPQKRDSSDTFQGRVFPQLQDTILGDFPKSII